MLEVFKRLDYKLWGINVGISIFFIITVLFLYPEVDTDEDGIVESIQVFFITLAMITFSYQAFVSKKIEKKLIGFGFSLLSLTFLLRELDVEKLDIPSVFIMIGSGTGRSIFVGGLWILLFLFIFKYKNFQKTKIVAFLTSIQGQFLIFSALMLILGAMMDKNVFSLPGLTTRFYEELLELLGYSYLFLSATFKVKY